MKLTRYRKTQPETGAVETNVVILVAAILFCICAVVWLVQAF